MAVRHLQNEQRRDLAAAMTSSPSVLDKFKRGFNDCIEEVDRYVSSIGGYGNDGNIKRRIVDHLTKCITGLEQVVHISQTNIGSLPFLTR